MFYPAIRRSQQEDGHQDQNGDNRKSASLHKDGIAVIDVDVGLGQFVVFTLQISLLRLEFLQCIDVKLLRRKTQINWRYHSFGQ